MKLFKKTFIFIAILSLTFEINAQVEFEDIGKWHNIVLMELMKNDKETRIKQFENPSLVQIQITQILNEKEPKLFDSKVLSETKKEISEIFNSVKWNEKGISVFVTQLKGKVGQDLYNQLIKIVNGNINNIEVLRKMKFSNKKDIKISKAFLDVFDASQIFWASTDSQKTWSWQRALWDAAGAVVGGASALGPIGGYIGSQYASYMYDLWMENQ